MQQPVSRKDTHRHSWGTGRGENKRTQVLLWHPQTFPSFLVGVECWCVQGMETGVVWCCSASLTEEASSFV